ncbi:MAG: family ATPase [Actinomycetota bacterium]|jgi:chromosome partitioning protein|nr:family ATPase [Actinomycetota bacterium]
MTISVVANQKGGVGKTLVTTGCAHAAAAAGKKVLVIDTDTQGSLTSQIADYTIDAPPPRSLADVLDRQTQTPLVEAVVASKRAGIDLLPSGFDGLQAVSDTLFGKPGAESSLARALAPVADRWDLVLIDTRPGTDLITRNAFMAADNIVMVLEPEVPAIRGGALTMRAIAELEEYLDKHLPVAGWVVNRLILSRGDHAEWLQKIRELASDDEIPMLGDPITLSADLARLTVVGMGIDEYRQASPKLRVTAATFKAIVDGIGASMAVPA